MSWYNKFAPRLIPENLYTDRLAQTILGECYAVIVMTNCTIEGCKKPKHVKSGLCSAHHGKFMRYGDPLYVKREMLPKEERLAQCKIDGCSLKPYGKNLCRKHYVRLATYGDPEHPVRTPKGELLSWIFANKDHDGDECLKWPFYTKADGYGLVQLGGKKINASRAMCIYANGEPENESMEAAHNCGKGHEGCVNPRHIEWKTKAENQADKIIHGTVLHGEMVKCAKLKAGQIKDILSLLKLGMSRRCVGAIYGVSRQTIDDIANKKTWVRVAKKPGLNTV